jgi:hypothetical protein
MLKLLTLWMKAVILTAACTLHLRLPCIPLGRMLLIYQAWLTWHSALLSIHREAVWLTHQVVFCISVLKHFLRRTLQEESSEVKSGTRGQTWHSSWQWQYVLIRCQCLFSLILEKIAALIVEGCRRDWHAGQKHPSMKLKNVWFRNFSFFFFFKLHL